jgi:hypothetical protein
VSRATCLAGKGPALVKRRNKANHRFTSRPKGVSQVTWHCVAALGKGMPFPSGCALFQVTWNTLYPSNLGCSTTSIELYCYLHAITRSILLLLRVIPKALETFKD